MNYKNTIRGISKTGPTGLSPMYRSGSAGTVHVKNTGRCELLVRKLEVILEKKWQPCQKNEIRSDCVNKGGTGSIWIPRPQIKRRRVGGSRKPFSGGKWNESGVKTYGNSVWPVESERRKAFIEVKAIPGKWYYHCVFPDNAYRAWIKHLYELMKAATENGYEAYTFFW